MRSRRRRTDRSARLSFSLISIAVYPWRLSSRIAHSSGSSTERKAPRLFPPALRPLLASVRGHSAISAANPVPPSSDDARNLAAHVALPVRKSAARSAHFRSVIMVSTPQRLSQFADIQHPRALANKEALVRRLHDLLGVHFHSESPVEIPASQAPRGELRTARTPPGPRRPRRNAIDPSIREMSRFRTSATPFRQPVIFLAASSHAADSHRVRGSRRA